MSNEKQVKQKRWRKPTAKRGELKVSYGSDYGELDIYYCHGGGGANRCDSRMLSSLFESTKMYNGLNLREELIKRGYDITTLKFSIQQLPEVINEASEL